MATVFRIDGVDYPIVSDPTLGEAAALQSITGAPLSQFDKAVSDGDVLALTAAIFISMKRVNHRTTLQDVQALPLAVVADAVVDTDAVEDSSPTDAPKSTRGRRPPA